MRIICVKSGYNFGILGRHSPTYEGKELGSGRGHGRLAWKHLALEDKQPKAKSRGQSAPWIPLQTTSQSPSRHNNPEQIRSFFCSHVITDPGPATVLQKELIICL